jgi:hypothetical protein
MSLWILLLIVCFAGAIGGVINALLTNNGFIMPQSVEGDGAKIWRPGYVGNVLIGAVAAGISWGLYGPLAGAPIFGESTLGSLAVSGFAGAVLVGIGGARWLSSEVDKNLLKAAASKAAAAQATPNASHQIAMASPAEAFKIAMAL